MRNSGYIGASSPGDFVEYVVQYRSVFVRSRQDEGVASYNHNAPRRQRDAASSNRDPFEYALCSGFGCNHD